MCLILCALLVGDLARQPALGVCMASDDAVS